MRLKQSIVDVVGFALQALGYKRVYPTGVRIVPRMPEIIGERQIGPETEDRRVRFELPPESWDTATATQVPNLPGIYVSPLQLRLDDFSGEGERAPPVPAW